MSTHLGYITARHPKSLVGRTQIPPVVRRAMHGAGILNIFDKTDREYPAGLAHSVASEVS